MPNVYLINGRKLDSEEALLFPIFSPGVPIENAFFESIRYENGFIPFWHDHVERIKNGFKYFDSKVFYKLERIYEDIVKFSGNRGVKYSKVKVIFDLSNNVCLIGIKELEQSLINEMKTPLFVSIHNEIYRSEYHSEIKKGSYEFQKRALAEHSNHNEERLIKNKNNKLIEGLFSNLFWIKDNIVFYVSKHSCILDGLMQCKIIKLCESLGIKIISTEGLSLKEYQKTDALFLTNMVKGVRCVRKIDDQYHNEHLIIDKIQESLLIALED